MNGLQTLINQWTHIANAGDLSLYSNDTIAVPSFIVIHGAEPDQSIVSLEVFRALGYQPPFADQATAMTAMEQLAAMGGSAAIPGIIGQVAPPPIAVAPLAPVAIDPTDTHTLGMVPVEPVAIPAPSIVPEPSIVHELIDGLDLVDMNTVPSDDRLYGTYDDPNPQIPTQPTIDAQADLVATMAPEPMIVTPVAAPIPTYPTAEDHAGLPHSAALAKLDDLVKLLASIHPVADDLRTAIATMAVASISNGPIVTADPGTRSMPSIARSTKADGFKWYLMIGPLTSLTEEQAIEQQTNLLKAAKFTRTPKLDPPGDNDVEGFGEVWYTSISESQAARLAWMDGTQLPVHNM